MNSRDVCDFVIAAIKSGIVQFYRWFNFFKFICKQLINEMVMRS
jgi:hypothetical protein